MALKSKAQIRKLKELVKDGLLSEKTFELLMQGTDSSTSTKLSERIRAKKMKIKEI